MAEQHRAGRPERKGQVSFSFVPSKVDVIDAEAKRHGMSRSELVNLAVDAFLASLAVADAAVRV